MNHSDTKTKRKLVDNAWKLALGPVLPLDECDSKDRYYAGYVGDKIAIHEKGKNIPPRVVAYFPGTNDGAIAAARVCDSLNCPIEKISIDEALSFE